MEAALRRELEAGLELQKQGRFLQAEAIFGRAIALYPESAESWHALGLVRHQQDDHKGAVDAISRAILLDASKAFFFNNYGAALQHIGRIPDAIAAFRAALQLRVDYFDATLNLLRALNQQSQWPSAVKLALASAAKWPNEGELLVHGRVAAENIGRSDLALQCSISLLKLIDAKAFSLSTQDHAALLRKTGDWLINQFRAQDAIDFLNRALELEPGAPDTLYHLARAFSATDDYQATAQNVASGKRAAPTDRLWSLLEIANCPAVFRCSAELDEYRAGLERQLDKLLAEGREIPRDLLLKSSFIPPYALGYQGRVNRTLREKFARVCARSFTPMNLVRSTSRLSRIGFVVTASHEQFFLQCCGGILRRLDPNDFKLVVFADEAGVEFLKAGLQRSDIEYVPLPRHLRKSAHNIADAKCDVLYYWEIGSDTLNYFLPFMQPAPVQCLAWGTQGTSGNNRVKYFVTSDLVESPAGDAHYTESLWRLKSLPTWQDHRTVHLSPNRSLFGLNNDAHLFLVPQNLMKCQPEADVLWGSLLRNDPRGRLIFMQSPNPKSSQLLRERFAVSLPDVADRIDFLPFQSRENYYRLLLTADVLLDIPSFSAGSSAYDIFSLNRAVVTLPGETFQSRYTAGCYQRMGLTELVAASEADYVHKAIRLANDSDYRHSIQQELAKRSEMLFGDETVVAEHAVFFEAVAEQSQRM